MDFAHFIAVVKDTILSIAAIVTTIVAYKGVEKWKLELRGKANFDVARVLIKAIYELRDEIGYCRSPIILPMEFPHGFDPFKNTSKERGDAHQHVYSKRWEPVANSFQKFEAAVLEAEALWGSDIRDNAAKLKSLLHKLRREIEVTVRNEYSNNEEFRDSKKRGDTLEVLHGTFDEDDAYQNALKVVISSLENEIRPHLSRN